MVPPRIRRCPECGHRPSAFSADRIRRGRTGRDGPDRQAKASQTQPGWTPEQKAIFFGELKGFCEAKGYAPGWAANIYKDRFGVWPDRLQARRAAQPSFATLSWIRNGQRAYAQKMRARESSVDAGRHQGRDAGPVAIDPDAAGDRIGPISTATTAPARCALARTAGGSSIATATAPITADRCGGQDGVGGGD